jgi:hypothetical protein
MFSRANARVSGLRKPALAAAILAAAWIAAAPGAVAAGLFAGLAGSWRGDGSVAWSTGETERIRCNAVYEVQQDGNKLLQKLTCATDSTRLIVKSDIAYNPSAGAISGTWSESTYGVTGRVTGNANVARVLAIVQSSDKRFTARVTLMTKGDTQTVKITSDLELREVNVQLRRAAAVEG